MCGKGSWCEELDAGRSVAVGSCQDAARLVIPENEARTGIPSGKNRQALPRNVKILQTFQPQMPAIGIFDHDVIGGLNHRINWGSQGAIPPVQW